MLNRTTMQKQKRTSWKIFQGKLNNLGLLNPPQAKQMRTAKLFYQKNPVIKFDSSILLKADHEISLTEFKSIFAQEALKITEYESAKSADAFLTHTYREIIINAVKKKEPNVNVDGIEMIRFRSEHMADVKTYCRLFNITLD